MDMLETLAGEYMRPFFYFSLKKTGDRGEAEVLTQEILLEIIKSLRNGAQPENFRAWAWQIARNRYARWVAASSAKRSESGYFDGEAEETAPSAEEEVVSNLEKAGLYRELSLLGEEYRSIIVAYYFENRSLASIAESAGVPYGTAKRKIFECRKHLKECMEMTREYGKRSFRPEEICILMNWEKGEHGRKYVERRAPANICLQAYDNPSTAEQLSLELGIAMPYLEEELQTLLSVNLLLEKDGRYATNFLILGGELQKRLEEIKKTYAAKLFPHVKSSVDAGLAVFPSLPEEALRWTLTAIFANKLMFEAGAKAGMEFGKKEVRPDGGVWSLVGYEKTDIDFLEVEETGAGAYSLCYPLRPGMRRETLLTTGEVAALDALIEGSAPGHALEALRSRGLAIEIRGGYAPSFPVLNAENKAALNAAFASAGYADALALAAAMYAGLLSEVAKETPPYLKGKPLDTGRSDLRGHLFALGTESGWLKIPESIERSPAGVWRVR